MFGKGDYHHLDALPSACCDEAMVLATPRRKSWTKRLIKLAVFLILLVSIGIGSLFIALEEGYLDQTLTSRAEQGLSSALGADFKPEVGAVRLRFSSNWMLALAAVDVRITHVESGIVALRTDSITAVLDPLALLRGRVALARAEIGKAEGDLRFLPPGAAIDWKTVRIDSVPQLLASFYPNLDRGVAALEKASTEEIVANSISLLLPTPTPLGDKVELKGLEFFRRGDGKYVLSTDIHYGKLNPRLTLSFDTVDGRADAINLDLAGVASEPLLLKYSRVTGEPRYGIDLPLDLAMTAERDRNLVFKVTAGEGLFYADGDAVSIKGGKGLISYDFKDRKLELSDGLIDLGQTVIPLEGGALDLDRTVAGKPPGFAFEVVGNDAVADAEGSGELPEQFNASARGYFLPATQDLQLDTIGVSTESGSLAGSLHVRFAKPSPAVNFAARADSLSATSVKQLWPFWFGKKARHWILTNIKGGTVKNAEIDVSLAAGRIPDHPEPLVFGHNELHISFDAEDMSVKFINEMPPSIKTDGHFVMQDRNIKIDIGDGEIALPSGKVIDGKDGVFEIADISEKPMMARLAITAAGEASAVAELSSYKPIDAMSRAPFAVADLTGNVEATVSAAFGLDRAQNPPKPDFDIALNLDKVSLKQPFQNRRISNLNGTLVIDPQSAVLEGKADIDGMGMDVSLTEPLAKDEEQNRQWQVEGQISESEILKIAPSLAPYISGKVGIMVENAGDKGQKATIDLTSTGLSFPVVGWRKGPGIAATADFTIASRDGLTDIRDLDFTGDGFGVRGNMTLDKRGLVSAKFSRVKLSSADNFALSLTRKSGGYKIDVDGESIDMRPFLDRVKSSTSPTESNGLKTNDTVTATIGRASGYNKESLSSVILKLTTTKGVVASMNFSAVTRSRQAVVIKRDGVEGAIDITAGDAGAVARFTDFYRNMNGGLLNVTLKARNATSWRGSIDIRNFALVNEQRLKSIVSARSGKDGRSLSQAVKADIDVSSQKFRRGFARILLDGKQVRVENGIVRGDEVGATFQGLVRDEKGRTEMTGTFMPAYGLNRLFSELPLIGSILGNGRDRGLLGITFKLEGPFDQPKLSVNPLSLIAPGVFRNIFEFE
ncbi:MAG: putative transrane protein [Rhizobium sp.]|nr:putative transrane protein [Rhizobium sp.]